MTHMVLIYKHVPNKTQSNANLVHSYKENRITPLTRYIFFTTYCSHRVSERVICNYDNIELRTVRSLTCENNMLNIYFPYKHVDGSSWNFIKQESSRRNPNPNLSENTALSLERTFIMVCLIQTNNAPDVGWRNANSKMYLIS